MSVLSPTALEWVESVLQSKVVQAKPLAGGMSSEVHLVRTSNHGEYVVRHISNEAWLTREPDLILREATALDLLAESEVTAPRHIDSAPEAGLLLMSYLPGRLETTASALQNRTDSLAKIAVSIASVVIEDHINLPPWRSWVPTTPEPPEWGTKSLWAEAIDAYRTAEAPRTPNPVLLHRDLHPLNVLWNDDKQAAVVDWVNVCVGHPHAEIGHCRWNLAVLSHPQASESFLDHYITLTDGFEYEHWWDLAAVLSFLPGPIGTSAWQSVGRLDLTDTRVTSATERFLQTTLDRV